MDQNDFLKNVFLTHIFHKGILGEDTMGILPSNIVILDYGTISV